MPATARAPAQTTTLAPLRIKLFGSPQLSVEQGPVALPRRQMRALLYRLAASLQPVPRDQICFLFWPDQPEATARRYLTVLLNQLRQALPVPDVLLTQRDAVLLDPAGVEVDTVALARAMGAAPDESMLTRLSQAVELYDGPFLHGFTLPASPEFDTWADQERHTWERRYLDALALLVEGYAGQGAYPQAVAAAQRALAVDELAEDMHRRLIELYAASGDRTRALRQFERCVAALERELGVSPLPETRAVYEDVREGRFPAHAPSSRLQIAPPASAPAQTAAPLAAPLLKLPAAPTPLLGRAEELAQASALLIDPDVRLLTLCGPGGSGKTRLAQQIAWDVADLFADGVVFVPLAALRDPALVLQTIAGACELKQASPAALAEFLRARQLLLVLDNCEHLIEAAPEIAALLAAAPQLHILATSRAALNVQGEHTLSVPPLPLPDLARLPPPQALTAIPAVGLLLARTQALNPRFQLTADNAADLAAICVRLDGLPLAIELAAARLKLIAPRDLLRRLDRRLAVLTGGPRDLPDRQRTLHATIDWSYRLLDADEQIWFERCSVFVDGWTLEAVEDLHERLRWPGQATAQPIDALAALVDKSLVQVSAADNGESRFSMLETIREFAGERLRDRGALEAVAQAHARHFLSLVEAAKAGLQGARTAQTAAQFDLEHGNIRAALHWFLDQNEAAEQALVLGAAMYRFWHLRGYYSEGLRWLERILVKSAAIAHPLRAESIADAGFLASALGQTDRAIDLFEACLALCETVEAPLPKIMALNGLGIILDRQNNPRGVALLEEAAELSRGLTDPARQCAMLRAFASALVLNGVEVERGLAIYEEVLALAREHRLVRNIAVILCTYGSALIFTGDYARAEALLTEGLALQRDLNDTAYMAWSFLFLGVLAYLQDQYEQARQHLLASLAIVATIGNVNTLPEVFDGLAAVLAMQGQPARAARLLGAAEALRASSANRRVPVAETYYQQILSSVRARLSEQALREAWDAGRKLSLEQALAEAQAVTP